MKLTGKSRAPARVCPSRHYGPFPCTRIASATSSLVGQARLGAALSLQWPPLATNTLDDDLRYAAGDALTCAVVRLGLSRAPQLLGWRIPGCCWEAFAVRPHGETDNAPLPFSAPPQQRYERIRPLLLDPERTAAPRAQETGTHPATGGRLKRRFAQQGMRGLVPATQEGRPARRQRRVPECVVQELPRLKGLSTGCGARALARILFHTTMQRLTGQTARRLWDRRPPAAPPPRPLLDYHSQPERPQARLAVLTL